MSKDKKYSYVKEIEIKYRAKKVEGEINDRVLSHPKAVVELFSDLQNETKEKLIAISLNSRHKIICFEVVALGSVESIQARPMEVFRTPIVVNARSIIVIHNHPSGDPHPSPDDIDFTKRMVNIARELGLTFDDHIIIGRGKYFSFKFEAML